MCQKEGKDQELSCTLCFILLCFYFEYLKATLLCLIFYFVPTQVRHNDLDYYERLTNPNGPAMTHAMFAIGWLEVGEIKKADGAFLKNYDNIQGPFKVETRKILIHYYFV